MWSGNFKMAVNRLRKSKLRSFFTMAGIIIGISSVVTIISLGEGIKHQITGQVNQVGHNVVIVRPGKFLSGNGNKSNLNLLALLTPSTIGPHDVIRLAQTPGVESAVPIDFVSNVAANSPSEMDNAFVAGTTSDLADLLKLDVNYGTFFSSEDNDGQFAVIGSDVAQTLFQENNPVGQTITVAGQDFIVHGVLKPTASGILSVAQADLNEAVFIPFNTALGDSSGRSNILQILVKGDGNPDQNIARVDKALLVAHPQHDFSVLKPSQLTEAAGSLVNVIAGITTAIAAVSLLVGGIGIMDIMLASISERNREIGLRKAVGATNRQILRQFLTEGLVLTISGGLIGLALAVVVNALIRIYTSWEPVISWPLAIGAVVFCVLIGVIFSTVPALKAARKDPITALRGD